MIAPQLWQPKYSPRYRVAWVVEASISWGVAPWSLLVIRYILNKRNKQRLAAMEAAAEAAGDGEDEGEFGFIDTVDEQGNVVKQKVEISMLDLTDLENKRFIYPL
ncbi:unnamed protein product [Ambrosiozyma monospora]|uniref:Unnamed protein product n=1 Tax=Ambrosiozyma monospora TaxID=43982 RepID=A0ACB5TUW4_AMBMO|nr:unnamed protein product [Ambrosiozyma monospora]